MRTSQPGPQGQATPAPWRRWLLPLGGAAGIVALLSLTRGGPPGIAVVPWRLDHLPFVVEEGEVDPPRVDRQ